MDRSSEQGPGAVFVYFSQGRKDVHRPEVSISTTSFTQKKMLTFSLSLALAEIIIALAYLLRNFKMSLRSMSDIGAKNDRFTLQYEAHGTQVTFKPRS